MKLIKIIRTIIILYATGYAALCALAIMKGNNLQIFSHPIKPFSFSIYLWVALGCFAILIFEKTIRTLAKIPQRLFYLGIFILIVYAMMKLFV